jgi:hypothetical protein
MTTARRASWCQSANGPLMAWNAMNRPARPASNTRIHALTSPETLRADDGNRTRMTSLEGFGSGHAEERSRRSGGLPACPGRTAGCPGLPPGRARNGLDRELEMK